MCALRSGGPVVGVELCRIVTARVKSGAMRAGGAEQQREQLEWQGARGA